MFPIVIGWLTPYLGDTLPRLRRHTVSAGIIGDAILLLSLFVLSAPIFGTSCGPSSFARRGSCSRNRLWRLRAQRAPRSAIDPRRTLMCKTHAKRPAASAEKPHQAC